MWRDVVAWTKGQDVVDQELQPGVERGAALHGHVSAVVQPFQDTVVRLGHHQRRGHCDAFHPAVADHGSRRRHRR